VQLEEDYGYMDADLKVMCEKYGSLAAHHEKVMAEEAASHEEALSAMGASVASLKVGSFDCFLRVELNAVACVG